MVGRLAAVLCVSWLVGRPALAGEVVVRIPHDGGAAPRWATEELGWLDAMSGVYYTFLDKFVEGKVDIPPVKELAVDGGCDDDWGEGLAMWDFYALNRQDERVQKAYVRFWNVIYQERRMPKVNPFWCTGGFDAEHYSELFQLLWGSIELEPTNKKLAEDNRKALDFIMQDYWDPKVRLLKSSWHFRPKPGEHVGDEALNTIWLTAALHAYLTTGEKKYRDWALEYGTSWNELAAANGGAFPYYVPPGTRTLDGKWYTTPWQGFGYEQWGITTGMRALNTLPTTLCLLDRGNAKHVEGLKSTVKVFFAKGRDGLPAAQHDGKDWVRGEKGNWSVPRLLDHVYALTFDPEVAKMIKDYIAAAAKVKEAGNESEFLRYLDFYYFDGGSLDGVATAFRNAAGRARDRAQKIRGAKAPKDGDEVRGEFTPYVTGMEYVVGSFWGRYDNGRCGGPPSGSVRYFTAEGKPGLPMDAAALVRRVAKEEVVVLVHSRAKTDTALVIAAGWYGQNRWKSVRVNDGEEVAVGSRRLRVELAPGATGKVAFRVERFVNEPTLEPQKAD